MDAKVRFTCGLLMLLVTTQPGLSVSRPQSAPIGQVYVRVRMDGCAKTNLEISLERLKPLPPLVVLRVKAVKGYHESGEYQIDPQRLHLQDGKYHWAGILPLGEYALQLCDARRSNVLLGEDDFTNERFVKRLFDDAHAEPIQIRGGETEQESGLSPNTETYRYTIEKLSYSAKAQKIHIILIDSKGELADQYLGQPRTSWKSKPLPAGKYKKVIIEYGREGVCNFMSK